LKGEVKGVGGIGKGMTTCRIWEMETWGAERSDASGERDLLSRLRKRFKKRKKKSRKRNSEPSGVVSYII